MGVAQKFLFDLSFDPAPEVEAPAVETPPAEEPPAAPTFSAEELEAALAEGFEAGRQAALAEAAASRDAALAQALTAIGERLSTIATACEVARADAERTAIELALAVTRKFLPALARRNALAEVTSLVGDCLRDAMEEPRIVVRVADTLFEAARDRIGPLAANSGFGGKVVVLADETLGEADCRVEWADGGAERDEARLWRDIAAAVERALAARQITETKPAETNSDRMPGDQA